MVQNLAQGIVLPQVMKAIAPSTGSYAIGMLKRTLVASLVVLEKVMKSVKTTYTQNSETILQ